MSEVRTGGSGPCPECGGEGEISLGPLRLSCAECGGSGKVDGDDATYRADGWKIPEDGEEYDPDVHGPLSPVASHPAVIASDLCRTCLGARVVVTETYEEVPCPRCSGEPLR